MAGFDNSVELANQPHADALYERLGWPLERKDYRRHPYDLMCKGLRTEEKYRTGKDYGDFLIELIQCVKDNNPGWFFTEEFDVLHYFVECDPSGISPPSRLHRVDWREVRPWLLETYWPNNSGELKWSGAGYGLTLNTTIDWKDLPENTHQVLRI